MFQAFYGFWEVCGNCFGMCLESYEGFLRVGGHIKRSFWAWVRVSGLVSVFSVVLKLVIALRVKFRSWAWGF